MKIRAWRKERNEKTETGNDTRGLKKKGKWKKGEKYVDEMTLEALKNVEIVKKVINRT